MDQNGEPRVLVKIDGATLWIKHNTSESVMCLLSREARRGMHPRALADGMLFVEFFEAWVRVRVSVCEHLALQSV